MPINKRTFLSAGVVTAWGWGAASVFAQSRPFKIGLLLPMTGPFASTGRQIQNGVNLYLAQFGSKVAGRQIEILLKDDTGLPDVTKRLAQELVVNEKVDVLAGFGLTPLALSTAPIATQSRTPMVVMAAATSSITEASPYIIRTSLTVPQVTLGVAEWAPKHDIHTAVSLVTDYGPGYDAEKTFRERFTLNGGKVLAELRVPLRNPDYAPFLQKVRDLKPDALFVFVPAGAGIALLKQFAERGLDKAGIKLIGEGSVADDESLNDLGDVALGLVTSQAYSVSHDSALNKKFVEAFMKQTKGVRPNFFGVAAYDGMHVIYNAIKATKGGVGGGDALLAAMKGQVFESPRGPIYIDAQTRDIVQNVYVRRVERINGQLYNTEIDVLKDVKDPGKTGK
ncbi:MAG: ABC transporter substrate-binding protein [Burkholderiaceae bacterium]